MDSLLVAQITAIAALAASAYLALKLWKTSRQLEEYTKTLALQQKRLSFIEKVLGKALESVEAEKALKLLKRRRRKRYIVFQLVTEDGKPVDPNELEKAIVEAVAKLSGDLTVAMGRIRIVYYHPDKMMGILAATHDTKYPVIASMALVRQVGGRRVLLIPLKTTGTIRRAKKTLGLPLKEE